MSLVPPFQFLVTEFTKDRAIDRMAKTSSKGRGLPVCLFGKAFGWWSGCWVRMEENASERSCVHEVKYSDLITEGEGEV